MLTWFEISLPLHFCLTLAFSVSMPLLYHDHSYSVPVSRMSPFITSHWKRRLTHVCIPMTETTLESAYRLLVFPCFCLLQGGFCKLPVVSSVPAQHCRNITQELETTFVNVCVQISRNFWSLSPAAIWACRSLPDMWTVQNLFWVLFKLWFCPWECLAFDCFKCEDVCNNRDRKAETQSLKKEC